MPAQLGFNVRQKVAYELGDREPPRKPLITFQVQR